MALFAKIVHGFQSLSIFSKRSILGVWLGCEYSSVFHFSGNNSWECWNWYDGWDEHNVWWFARFGTSCAT